MKKVSFTLLLLLTLFIAVSCGAKEPDFAILHSKSDSGYIPVIPPSGFPLPPISSESFADSETEKSVADSSSVCNGEEPPIGNSSVSSGAAVGENSAPAQSSLIFEDSSAAYPTVVYPELTSPHTFIYSVERNAFLYINGNETVIYPASTTKLLTILYAKTLLPLDMEITPGNELELVKEHSSLAYVQSHHRLTVEQLIEGMLLPSGNDAAYVLAAAAGRELNPRAKDGKEAVSAFMNGLNLYAERIGMVGSFFVSPDGYEDETHYSTLEDMALVSKLAYQDETIRKYGRMVQDDVVYASGHINTWINSNLCLDPKKPYYLPEVNGLKTGSLDDYYCLILSMEVEGQSFIVGFFGEPDNISRFTDAATALRWIKENCIARS